MAQQSPASIRRVLWSGKPEELSLLFDDVVSRTGTLDAKDESFHGATMLHIASVAGNRTAAEALLERGAAVDPLDGRGATPLFAASAAGHAELVSLLLDRGAGANRADSDGYLPIMEAASHGHAAIVERLVGAGADLSAVVPGSKTSVLHAACEGNSKGNFIAASIISSRAPGLVDAENAAGRTPVEEAFRAGFVFVCCAVLCTAETDLNSADLNPALSGRPLLFHACVRGDISAIDFLVSNGADVNAKDESLSTPLHEASSAGNTALVEFLLEKGADKDAVDEGQSTPLHQAVVGGHAGVVRILVGAGADVGAKDGAGLAPPEYVKELGLGEEMAAAFL